MLAIAGDRAASTWMRSVGRGDLAGDVGHVGPFGEAGLDGALRTVATSRARSPAARDEPSVKSSSRVSSGGSAALAASGPSRGSR